MEKVTKTVLEDGTIEYRNSNGQKHREDGPAIENTYGDKVWYQNGKLHRENGPAIEWNDGSKEWWLNDKIHRTDGPAIENINGNKEWYINGQELTEQEFNDKMNIKPYNVSTSHDIDFTYESKLITSINEFKKYLKK